LNDENNAEDRNLYVRSKKSGGGERIATLIEPVVHLKFMVLALEGASPIEGKRIPKEKGIVHSYRFLPDAESGVILPAIWVWFFLRFCKCQGGTKLWLCCMH
jgi:hypothetical protein